MHPVLFSIGPVSIYSYGAMMALGLLAAVALNSWLARGNGLSPQRVQNAMLWVMLAALAGARIFFVLIEPQQFIAQPWRVLFFWEGGLVFYGGLIGGIIVGLVIARRARLPVLQLFDNMMPGIALGAAFGRVGCFLAGCCYGKAWDGWCAVVFTAQHTLAPKGIALHPTQLYEAAAYLLICIILLAFWRARRRLGRISCLFGILAAIERMLVEQFRDDWRGTPMGPDGIFTPTFIVALIILAISLLGFIILSVNKGAK